MYEILTEINRIFPAINRSENQQVAKRGRQIARDDSRIEIHELHQTQLSATVYGTHEYLVELDLINGEVESSCTCPFEGHWGGMCKHIFALLYGLRNELLRLPKDEVTGDSLASLFGSLLAPEPEAPPLLSKSWVGAVALFRTARGGLSFQLGEVYVRGDGEVGRFKQCSERDYDASFGGLLMGQLRQLTANNNYLDKLRGEVLQWVKEQKVPLFAARADSSWHNPKLTINNRLQFSEPRRIIFLQERSDDRALLPMLVDAGGEQIPLAGTMELLAAEPLFLLHGQRVIPVESERGGAFVQQLLAQTEADEVARITITEEDAQQFDTQYLPLLKQIGELSSDEIEQVVVTVKPVPELYLSEPSESNLRVTLQFRYEELLLLPGDEAVTRNIGGRIVTIERHEQAELGALKRLIMSGLKAGAAAGELKPTGSSLRWVVEVLPKLRAEGWQIFGEKDLLSLKTIRLTPSVAVGINAENDWFDTTVEITAGDDVLPLNQLLSMIRNKETGYRDNGGRWVEINASWINRFRPLLDGGYELDNALLKIPRTHWSAVDALFLEMEATVDKSEGALALIDRFKRFESVRDVPLSENLRAVLRPYQQAGLDWLVSLQQLQCGGCLADDMGLGKTVMTIALLCREYDREQKPTLIVAPTSVLYNWQREFERFAPHLKPQLYYGADRELTDAPIVLTSYALLRNDIKELSARQWHYAILDEAQAIKNPAAQTTRAARLLKATNRLALTGTPVENGLTELWSLFSFLNPGLLFSEKLFRERFVKEVEQNGRQESASYLHRLVKPFLLRRTKELVTPELPPKTETILMEGLTPVQEQLYREVRDSFRKELLDRVEKKGADRSKIEVLTGLMRLRQICCHPGLYDKSLAKEPSAKFDMLDGLLEEIVAEGHKVLIFSQFVGMLTLVEKHLKGKKIESVKLTGRTRNREKVVDQFKSEPSITAFLISLKAGGTGLNLVEADYVIHLDPWWNPAVEAQASDRVYRIGQDKPVFVYKCVTRGTVEEKILSLQERKRDISDSVITTDESIVKALTAEDIAALFS